MSFHTYSFVRKMFFTLFLISANALFLTAEAVDTAPQYALKILNADICDAIIGGGTVVWGDLYKSNEISAGFCENSRKNKMTSSTIIDIASLTKVCATTTALLVCKSRGLVDFDEPFTKYLPQYSGKIAGSIPTVRDLANHTSGFYDAPNAKRRSYVDASGKKIIENVLKTPPPFPISQEAHYACWNYILLSLIVENITGQRFDDFCRKEIFEPLKMSETSLGRPVNNAPQTKLAQTIGTNKAGEISDFVARPIYDDGLCTGNAGMFSTANDLAKLMQCYLAKGKTPDGKTIFSETAYSEILYKNQKKAIGTRSLGWSLWETGLPDEQFADLLVHSGWSGQTVCIDVRQKKFAIVLTTRYGDYDRAKQDRFKIVSKILGKSK